MHISSEALKKYGIMPELIGRLHVKCALTGLTENDLVHILTDKIIFRFMIDEQIYVKSNIAIHLKTLASCICQGFL